MISKLTNREVVSTIEVFRKKGVPRNFTKFTSHMYTCFPVNFAKFLRTSFFIELLRWLLLKKRRESKVYFPREISVPFDELVLKALSQADFIK